jgi:uncharacterized tellurite resistance protein B-like protein
MKSGFAPRLRELVVTLAGSEAVALQRSPRDGLELSLKVMSLISVADGVVDEAEIELVQDLYAEQSAGTIAAATVEQAFRIVSADQESVWQELRGAHDLDERVRREIFDAACDVAASDGALHADEVALIRRLGSVLGLAGRYIEERIVGR